MVKTFREQKFFPKGTKVPKQYANEHSCDTGEGVYVYLYDDTEPKKPVKEELIEEEEAPAHHKGRKS